MFAHVSAEAMWSEDGSAIHPGAGSWIVPPSTYAANGVQSPLLPRDLNRHQPPETVG